MYRTVSLLPNSITSGAVPPAGAASNFVRWAARPGDCTATSAPGCLLLNASVVDVTIGSHPLLAPFWSQMTTCVADCRLGLEELVEAATAEMSSAAASARAPPIVSRFIQIPPVRCGGR